MPQKLTALAFGSAGDRPAENHQTKGYQMRTFMTGLPKGSTMRWSILAAVLAAGGLSLAWMDQRPLDQHHYRFGGAWVGGHAGFMYNLLQIPTDPAGKTEAFRVEPLAWGADIAGLLSAFGADKLTDAVGEGQMISQDTARWTCFAYAQASAIPAVTAVAVYTGTFKFLSPDTAEVTYTVQIYPLSADGYYPDFSKPLLPEPIGPISDSVKRVPIL